MIRNTHSPEEALQRFESLPPEIQTLLYSAEMYSAITKVSEKHQLHLDQMDILNTETAQVMLGFTDTKDFPGVIAADLTIDISKANQIAQDISDTLFAQIREAMKAGPAAQPATAPAPVAAPIAPAAPISPATPVSINKIPESAPPAAPLPVKAADMHPADMMLTQKTAATPAAPASVQQNATPATAPATAAPDPTKKNEPPKPDDYKADPYREPVK